MSTQQYQFAGGHYALVQANLGKGGQGVVHKVQRQGSSQRIAIVKEIPHSPANQRRLQVLLDHKLGHTLPFVSAPLALQKVGDQLAYLAPFSAGVSLEEDRPRSFPEVLEMATILACLWEKLEGLGIAHGDIAPSNLLIEGDGTPCLIDFDNFTLSNPAVPGATMLGQHAMMAPEIRQARHAKAPVAITLESDRFAWAVLMNVILLGRHPSDGLVQVPADVDRVMTSGQWPERQRTPETGETPLAVLGSDLPLLFDRAFHLNPRDRPTAQDWRQALFTSLKQTVIHRCGGGFVRGSTCPYCSGTLLSSSGCQLTVTVLHTQDKGQITLPEGQAIILGKDSLPNMSGYVSGQHLRIDLGNNQLTFTHLGRNRSKIADKHGTYSPLPQSTTLPLAEVLGQSRRVMLADIEIQLDFART